MTSLSLKWFWEKSRIFGDDYRPTWLNNNCTASITTVQSGQVHHCHD